MTKPTVSKTKARSGYLRGVEERAEISTTTSSKPSTTEECQHLIGKEVHDYQKCERCGITLKDILAGERSFGWQEGADSISLINELEIKKTAVRREVAEEITEHISGMEKMLAKGSMDGLMSVSTLRTIVDFLRQRYLGGGEEEERKK